VAIAAASSSSDQPRILLRADTNGRHRLCTAPAWAGRLWGPDQRPL